jgi:hypothetical protein
MDDKTQAVASRAGEPRSVTLNAEQWVNVLPPSFFRDIEDRFPGKGQALPDEVIEDRRHERSLSASDVEDQRAARDNERLRLELMGKAQSGLMEATRRTQWLAFTLALLGLMGSFALAIAGALLATPGLLFVATVVFGGTLAAIVKGFLQTPPSTAKSVEGDMSRKVGP